MKKLIIVIMLAATGTVSFAQDTAYISQDKTTALFFHSAVKIIGKVPPCFNVLQKDSGLITIKAVKTDFVPFHLNVQEISTAKVYPISVQYSYGRAGRSINVGSVTSIVLRMTDSPQYIYNKIAAQLAVGNRKDVVDHEKTGRVKVWVDKLFIADNKVFFRLDIRNRSNLPYEVDFIRFYIRDLKTVARMATHEQEILPLYTSLIKRTAIVKGREVVHVFGFRRFSLSENQALNVELYERNGNRHFYLHIKRKDLEDLKTLNPVTQLPLTLAAHTTN